jgi:predicted nucleic acid-binding protein
MLIIPQGTRIFIDSNIFIYHFLGQSESCRSLLEMAEDLEIRGYASTVVLAEVLHKLMLTEATEKFGIKPHDVVRFLKRRPELIPELKKCEAAVGEIPDYNIEILPNRKRGDIRKCRIKKEAQSIDE